ncbi:hypothetical protein JQ599_32085 [Bradyrhizobium diazoefficiens]|nr:hypothetical protein [Bradyrhizobium diazoefficiens]MBR0704582.1 hypothetical protein [Bradyrhizobium diazoefficiens]MBR0773150.1 hypothetical protein [Bradyrhizobium diazoefficiens]
MLAEDNRELDDLSREIAAFRRHIHDQEILIQVLERDGHDVSAMEAALRTSRSSLASAISRQFQLMEEVTEHPQRRADLKQRTSASDLNQFG